MEKLIELLNEYCGEDEGSETKWVKEHLGKGGLLSLKVISKKFGFIEWLVENGKVREQRDIEEYRVYTQVELLLMRLSISDNPLDFLINELI